MPAAPPTRDLAPHEGGVRAIRRRETRARLFDAAISEIGRCGLAGADVSAIASAAGVVRGTFYFHFPTKEHVLVELQHHEELAIVADLLAGESPSDDLRRLLTNLVDRVIAVETRLGPVIFRDLLSLHFSPARPAEEELGAHPIAQYLVDVITRAQHDGRIVTDTDASELAVFFGTGVFALLATAGGEFAHASEMLRRYVTTILKGMETR